MLKIDSITESISGEIGKFVQGATCTIVRLAGCNLRCPYCDTKDTWTDMGSTPMRAYDVFKQIKTRNVLITGGEPLVQMDELEELVILLLSSGKYEVQIETNGSITPSKKLLNWSNVYPNMTWVVDYKGPSSQQELLAGSFATFISRWKLLAQRQTAIIKMVISNYDDLAVVKDFGYLFAVAPNTIVAFSPVSDTEAGYAYWVKQILETCQEDLAFELANGQVILSLQIHKVLQLP